LWKLSANWYDEPVKQHVRAVLRHLVPRRLRRRLITALRDPEEDFALRILVYHRPEAPRWGWGRPRHSGLVERLQPLHDRFLAELELIPRYGAELAAIDRAQRDDTEPCWFNDLFTGICGASLYAYMRDRKPRHYLEVGSGHSTRFAARAKRDGGLDTEIISIDPAPRADIDAVCDRVVRSVLEDADPALFDELVPGDIVFLDGSHRVLMGNDVVVFFLEVLPRIPAGVRIGVHDIYLPDDYGPGLVEEFWTEQYMLAMALLAGPTFEPVLPCHYVSTTSPLKERLNELWDAAGLAGINAWSSCFWFERADPGTAARTHP
jgi:hypothetical protein